jgi:Protein of unknown function (DUF3175)
METSNALDLEAGVFRRTPRQIALSLKRSAEQSNRRKDELRKVFHREASR